MMTANDIVDIYDLRNILSVFGIFYLIFFCLLPFFIVGFMRGIFINISLFFIGALLVFGISEGDESTARDLEGFGLGNGKTPSAFFDCWNTRIFSLNGNSINLKDSTEFTFNETYPTAKNYTICDRDGPKMFAMNDKNSPDYICSVFIFNPSSLWMCPGIIAIPVLFCLAVVCSLIKGSFSGKK